MEEIITLQTTPTAKFEQYTNDNKLYYVYNVSKDKDNYSQRKSPYLYIDRELKINWASLCNVHVLGMGLIYTGWYDKYINEINSKYPEFSRFPDKLAKHIIESERVREYYKLRFPKDSSKFFNGEDGALIPNEVHNVLSFGVNDFMNLGAITYFSTNVSWKEILHELIYRNCPVGISGKFSGLNHMVLCVGCVYSTLDNGLYPGTNQVPEFLIVDDPFGKTYEYQKGLSGNDVWIPFKKCIDDFKALDNPNFKCVHRFLKPNEIGI